MANFIFSDRPVFSLALSDAATRQSRTSSSCWPMILAMAISPAVYGHPYPYGNAEHRSAGERRDAISEFLFNRRHLLPRRHGADRPANSPQMFPATRSGRRRLRRPHHNHATAKEAGYRTGHFGKWHIGAECAAGNLWNRFDPRREGGAGRQRGRDAPIHDEAIAFIEKNKEGHRFMSKRPGAISDHPVNPPQSYVDKFKDVVVKETRFCPTDAREIRSREAAGDDISQAHAEISGRCCHSMDDDMGRLLKRIDELGLRDNTIVVFSSDQGGRRFAVASPTGKLRKKRQRPRRADLRLEHDGLRGGAPRRQARHVRRRRAGAVHRPLARACAGRPGGRTVASSAASTGCRRFADSPAFRCPTADVDGEDTSAAWLGSTFRGPSRCSGRRAIHKATSRSAMVSGSCTSQPPGRRGGIVRRRRRSSRAS